RLPTTRRAPAPFAFAYTADRWTGWKSASRATFLPRCASTVPDMGTIRCGSRTTTFGVATSINTTGPKLRTSGPSSQTGSYTPAIREIMAAPHAFTWVEKPLLAALARPSTLEDLVWLRQQGIQLVLSLTEDALRRDWVEEASLLVFHEPLEDMEPPTQEQLDRAVSAIQKATERDM